MSTILAHGSAGIWDEVLVVAIPLLVIIVFTIVSEVRSRRRGAEDDEGAEGDSDEGEWDNEN